MSEKNTPQGCTVCRLVRMYLLIAVPLIVAIGFGSGTGSSFLAQIDLLRLTSYLIGIGFVLTVGWRAYQEYWRK